MASFETIYQGQESTPMLQAERLGAKPRRARVAATVQYSAERAQRARQIYTATARSRHRMMMTSLLIIMMIATALGIILVQQSKLVEINYANAKLESEIRQLDISNRQRVEAIVRNTDLQGIEHEVQSMGFEHLNQDQLIRSARPMKDQVVRGQRSQDAQKVNVEAMEDQRPGDVNSLEEWYRAQDLEAGAPDAE